ncbi:hypothetical protein SLS56_007668 [Neofusicoccum ribis]|uniref:Aminoglycoside phosphotransferase domain-containing protein n=1 Tax=Neofusicoccum ribis TaxID=45134 RepID=A0ABR3SN07_9PEZI
MLGLGKPEHGDMAPKQGVPPAGTQVDRKGQAKWGPILSLPDKDLIELALEVASKSSSVPKDILKDGSDIKVTAKMKGENNRVFVVQYHDTLKICVRVPACGWEGAWTEKDAVALRTEALTMKYIKRHTKCPIGEIVTYDTTFNNAIHAPHIVTLYLEGRPVQDLWFEEDGPLPLEQKRQNILRSMASAVAELRHFAFDKMGALQFCSEEDDNPTVGPCHLLNFGASRTSSFLDFVDGLENEPQTSSEAFLRQRLEEWRKEETEPSEHNPNRSWRETYENLGTFRLFSMLLDELPFPKSGEVERFVLAPPDFDSQNILADEHGNVTALLDWDRTETTPAFVGWCRFPEFLHRDWQTTGHYIWPHWQGIFCSPAEYERYRADYARYMYEVCDGQGDCVYTAKSHLFERITDAVGQDTAQEGMLEFIMAIVVPRINVKMTRRSIGERGLRAREEEALRQGFKRLLSPREIAPTSRASPGGS